MIEGRSCVAEVLLGGWLELAVAAFWVEPAVFEAATARGDIGRCGGTDAGLGAARLDVAGIENLRGSDIDVAGGTNAGVARVDRADRGDQVNVTGRSADDGLEHADTTTGSQPGQVGLDVRTLVVNHHLRRGRGTGRCGMRRRRRYRRWRTR